MRVNRLIDNLLSQDKRALAKAITLVENEDDSATEVLDSLYQKLGHAYRIGVTGPPGAGKSTLVEQLTKRFRKQDKTVGIVAVDPTSPFTGGALLGDRVRMSEVALDPGVFIRSMATRGSLGGLSKKTEDVADIFDAFGKDIVILETVGVGQSELEIAQAADTTVVVLVPESGDSIQAMKAGLMEIADLFVVNKADREGADHAVMEIQSMLQLGCKEKQPVVLQAIASQGGGVDEIIAEIQKHRDFLSDNLLLEKKRKARILKKVKSIVRLRFEKAFWDEKTYEMINQYLENIGDSKLSPHKIADGLIDSFKKKLENTNDA